MKFEICSTKWGYWGNTLLAKYPQLKKFDIERVEGNFLQYYITISSLEDLEKLGKLLGEEIIINFKSYQIEIYDYYRE